MKAQLCICHNCLTVMYDENPQNQPEINPGNTPVVDMLRIFDSGGFFYACPICKTDDHLFDIDSKKQLPTPKQILSLKHRDLVRNGWFEAANWLLKQLQKKHGNFVVYDGQSDIYESGLADWIMLHFPWHNGRISAFVGSFGDLEK